MSSVLPKSSIRLEHEPRVFDVVNAHGKARATSKRRRDKDDRDKSRPKRSEVHRSAKKDTNHRRKVSHTLPSTTTAEEPYYVLDMVCQPAKCIQIGMPVEVSAVVSVELPSFNKTLRADIIDSSPLVAVASLVSDQGHGEKMSLEAGSMTGQKMFDSVHPVAEDLLEVLAQNHPCRHVLGYVSFPGLVIRQAGNCRLRITLLRMSNSGVSGATTLLAVDSEPIKVERRGHASQQRQQHAFG